jgi:hypothetical protein
MTIYVGKKTTRAEVMRKLKKLQRRKGFDAKKFSGIIKWGEDGLKFQKRMRDEWD